MEARFIGDPKYNGDGPATITVRGYTFEKGGAFVNVSSEALFAGHSHFQTREGPLDHDCDGKKGGSVQATDTAAEHRAAVIAELKAIEVTFAKNAKTETLEALLAAAKAPSVQVPTDEYPQRAELIAQLEGLGVEFDPAADTEALEAALDAATAPDEA